MKWEEVRSIYPNQFVKIEITDSIIKNNKQIVKNVDIISPVKNEEATKELLNSRNNVVVYHTSKDKIEIGIRINKSNH
ncbi:MAG: hypothetical protein ABF289_17020 [Clostridiales bacterium]